MLVNRPYSSSLSRITSPLLPGTALRPSFNRFAPSSLRTLRIGTTPSSSSFSFSSTAVRRHVLHGASSTTRALSGGRRYAHLARVATRHYVTLNELQRGGQLHLVYTGPHPSTIRTPAVRRSFRSVFMRNALLLCMALVFFPFFSHMTTYASGMDKASFERVMLWWLKYREKGTTPPHTGYLIVDGHELQKVLETKLGRPYTMEILETRLDEKIQALPDNMDGVELLIVSGKKSFGSLAIPFITVGVHARIRWTETVKIVGPNGIAHLNVTLRTISNPDKRDLSTQLLGKSRRVLIEKVELAFADSTSYVLNEASFGRQKRITAAKLKED